ncbi:hypothetical protein ACP70R_006112 [Stipagrostis hirtigluma subsp. patula]
MAQRQEGATPTGEGDEEQRLRAALRHLQLEAGVLERLVYKHRNQHRGAAYFQYLLKVRRDLKLLLGAGLAEVLNAVFPVLASRKPANTILVPIKQSKKKPGANHSHHERLLGVARLLSQMAEPVMKAAISFFVDLCAAVLSLLARVRVLTQQSFALDADPVLCSQMLLDVVSVYNKVTDLIDRKQAVKISIGGVQAFREYYPSMDDARTILECVWVKDKFVLHEKMKGSCQNTQDEDQKSCDPEPLIQYETLGLVSEEVENLEETNPSAKQSDASLTEQPDKINRCSNVGGPQSGRQLENEKSAISLPDTLSTPVSVPHLDLKPEKRKRVAFITVGKPKVTATPSETKSSEANKKLKLDSLAESGGLLSKFLECENADKSIL